VRRCRRNRSLDHLGHDLLHLLCLVAVAGDVRGKWGLLKGEGHWMEMHIERVRTKRFWIARGRRVLKEGE